MTAPSSQSELQRGDSLAQAGQPREAEACYTRAIESEPQALAPRFRRGHVRLFGLDDPAGALEDLLFVQANAEGRADAPPACNLEHLLGEAYFQLGRYQEATEHYEDALMLGGKAPVWAEQHLRLAECWEKLGQPSAMADALEAFLDLAPRAHARPEDVAWAREELARLRAQGLS